MLAVTTNFAWQHGIALEDWAAYSGAHFNAASVRATALDMPRSPFTFAQGNR